MRALGVQIDGIEPNAYRVHGAGRVSRRPKTSSTRETRAPTTRLIAGILAAQPFLTIVTGDESLRSRPMDRIIEPLRAMGAQAYGRRDNDYLPMAIVGGDLQGIDYRLPMASAQVKSCLLLAGALARWADAHRRARGVARPHRAAACCAGSGHRRRRPRHCRRGGRTLRAVDVVVPGDTSAAAFWLVAACIHATPKSPSGALA
jgi:3-phosphoshikimate 1-carboxyvinyltransferase